jgi:hypothetical protein
MVPDQSFINFANDPALALPVMTLARGQVRFASGSRAVIGLSQHGFCQIINRQQKKPSISVKKG